MRNITCCWWYAYQRCKGWAFFLWIIEAAMSGSLNMERPYLQATVIVSFVLSFLYKLVCNCTNPFVNDGNQPFWLQQPSLHNFRASVGGLERIICAIIVDWVLRGWMRVGQEKNSKSRRRCHKCFGHWALKSVRTFVCVDIDCLCTRRKPSFLSIVQEMSSGASFSLRHSGKGRCISLSDAGRLPIEQYFFRFGI